jgi:alpha-L-rhamnosidase
MNKLLILLFVLTLCIESPALAGDPLESGFQSPPQSARPQTWWHWMNGNITRVGIQDDLEAMKQIGLGGATIVNVDSGIPRGPVEFMSPEWQDDFKYAVQEANRLGLDLGVGNCAGWSSSGGPWITPPNAMQHVTSSEVIVTGPTNLSITLPLPPEKLDFYRDIAVLAFPEPAGECVRMADSSPKVTLSTGENGQELINDNPDAQVALPLSEPGNPQFVQLEFATPFSARTMTMTSPRPFPRGYEQIAVSDDGVKFSQVRSYGSSYGGPNHLIVSLGNEPVTARFWRLGYERGPRERATSILLSHIDLSPKATVGEFQSKDGDSGGFVLSSDSGTMTNGAVRLRDIANLTSKMDADGKLDWRVPSGQWIILRLGYTPTAISNHPAAWGGVGLECDKLSKAALDQHWNGFMQPVLDDAGPLAGTTFKSSLIDSYEVRGQNWTKDFAAEFRKRRGYDPVKYLPAFTGRYVENPAVSERFLWDVRRTIADLFAENYYGHFTELCDEHGLRSDIEPYTGPFESLQSGASAGLVMGEFWTGSQGEPSIKLASSIAHIYGKPLVGAESFTARPPRYGRWQEDPYALKALGDLMYCQGLNRFVFHRYAMQPWTNRWPGMTMGQWGIHFERTETWWLQGKPWIDYITRCQFLLQQGRAIQDAAYFDGESAPVETRSQNPSLPDGYDYDYVNAGVLLHGASVKNGRVTLASGANYAFLVLPPEDINMTPETLKGLRKLVRDGATIVGPRPIHSPSLEHYPRCDDEVSAIADELWGNDDGVDVQEHSYGKGRVIWGKPLDQIFAEQNLKPDFEFTNASGEATLAYTHRLDSDTDIYFVSNQRHEFDSDECTFRVAGKVPELWHPETGLIEPAPVWNEHNGRTTVQLNFDPAGSVFVIFRPATNQPDHIVSATASFAGDSDGKPQLWKLDISSQNMPEITAWTNGNVELRTAGGKVLRAETTGMPPAHQIDGSWNLSFPPNWGAPPSVVLDRLMSWTESTNDGVKYFSGTATYEKDIDIPADDLSANRELWLDLGEVKNFAEVSLNGRDFGVLWKPPYRVNVTAAAKPGTNHLVIKVTNLWPNRLIGDEQLPPDVEWNGMQLKEWPQWLLDGKPSPTGRLTFTTWHHWTKDSPLLTSGLLGPVTLCPSETVPVSQ